MRAAGPDAVIGRHEKRFLQVWEIAQLFSHLNPAVELPLTEKVHASGEHALTNIINFRESRRSSWQGKNRRQLHRSLIASS